MIENLLIDSREFNAKKITGIGRVITGLIEALAKSNYFKKIILAISNVEGMPVDLSKIDKVEILKIPASVLNSEVALTKLTNGKTQIYLSPYPKLPITGCVCPKINMVHDVFYITHFSYKKKMMSYVERIRLKMALKKANLTWFASKYSLEETKKLVGFVGNNPKVRYSGLDQKFSYIKSDSDSVTLSKYNLKPGYILAIGNGKPHKNLGILLEISENINKKFVFAGVSVDYQNIWKKKYPNSHAVWIDYIKDNDLPGIIRNSFCLAQPSTEEGYGLPPIEAMACGIPVVVSNIPVLKETTNGYAMTADPYDSNAWLKAFKALENQTLYRSQIEKGTKWAERFKGSNAWNSHLNDIKELFSSR